MGFVTKKEIDIDEDISKPSKINRKILSEKVIKVIDFNDTLTTKFKKNGSKKTIKLPPIEYNEEKEHIRSSIEKAKERSTSKDRRENK